MATSLRFLCHSLLLLSICGKVFSVYQDNDGVSNPQVYQPRSVYEYKSYRNVQLIHYKIPSQVTQALWQFTGFQKGDDSCPVENIQIALQWGSYPVIDPADASFPDNTYLKRTALLEFETPSDMGSLYVNLMSPQAGDWFAAVYLPPPNEAAEIQPKGFGEDCNYFLGSILKYHREIEIVTLSQYTQIPHDMDHGEDSVLYKFYITESIGAVTFKLEGCQYKSVINPVEDICAVEMSVEANAIPFEFSETINCMEKFEKNGTCQLEVIQPKRQTWYYIKVKRAIQNVSIGFAATVNVEDCGLSLYTYLFPDSSLNEDKSDKLTTFKVNITEYPYPPTVDTTEELSPLLFERNEDADFMHSGTEEGEMRYRMYIADDTDERKSANAFNDLLEDEGVCLPGAPMQRDKYGADFTVVYTYRDEVANSSLDVVNIKSDQPTVLSFDTRAIVEIGSHIKIQSKILQVSNASEVSVTMCLRKGAPPPYKDGKIQCESDSYTVLNTTSEDSMTLHMPYPEPGIWYLSFVSKCYLNGSNGTVYIPCSDVVQVSVKVNMEPCMLDCNGHGTCRRYYSGELLFATCVCSDNYGGWACTNDTYAHSDSFLLLQTCLLSLSNLFFLPAIIIAGYRWMFVESLVYFYTMFFSGFYHLCDSGGYCMMDYDTMQYCDFLASVIAFWVTLVAMAVLKPSITAFLHMLGTLVLITITKYDRFSLWIFIVPVGAGLILIAGSWIYKAYNSRTCFPGFKQTIIHTIPGLFTAGTGLVLYAFVENDANYYLIHSLWHGLIALSIIFLLPPKQKNSKKGLRRVPSDENMLSEDEEDEPEDNGRDLPQPI
ncbi:post-GPI attachment to proteins factor 6-like [Glandiceps talaboti]